MSRKTKGSLEAGFALALADLSRMMHIDDTAIRNALDNVGWTVDDLKKGGADAYDVEELRRVLNECPM